MLLLIYTHYILASCRNSLYIIYNTYIWSLQQCDHHHHHIHIISKNTKAIIWYTQTSKKNIKERFGHERSTANIMWPNKKKAHEIIFTRGLSTVYIIYSRIFMNNYSPCVGLWKGIRWWAHGQPGGHNAAYLPANAPHCEMKPNLKLESKPKLYFMR